MGKEKILTITLPLHIAETLHGLIDGCIGTSEDEIFSKQMSVVRKKLEKEFTIINGSSNKKRKQKRKQYDELIEICSRCGKEFYDILGFSSCNECSKNKV